MKILIIGFQRSGTTLLRRLVTMHPKVRSIFHEEFLLTKYKTLESLKDYIKRRKINIDQENWGDKTPYYPNIRKIPVGRYCETWNQYFGKQARILHIFRHPYDIAFSIDNKYRTQNFQHAIKVYKQRILSSMSESINLPNVMAFKYEDLVLNPGKLVPDIYKFCGLNPEVNFKKLMRKWENKKYQSFDKSRVFAYKNKTMPKFKGKLDDIIMDLNENLGGIEYQL